MDAVFWFAQAIGGVGLIYSALSYQSKTRLGILNRQSMGSLVYIFHYLMLSAWTGAVMNAIVVIRNWVFVQKDKKAWAKSDGWMYFFMALCLVTLPFSWEGLISLLPVASMVLGVYSRWHNQPSQIRLLALVGSLLWIPYNLFVHSYAGFAVNIVIIIAVIIGMFRHDKIFAAEKQTSGL